MRNRTIKKVGGSLFIQLLKADVDDFGLVEGDKVDIDDLNLLKIKRGTTAEHKAMKRKLK